jgi:hypothetical protein
MDVSTGLELLPTGIEDPNENDLISVGADDADDADELLNKPHEGGDCFWVVVEFPKID